MSSFEGHCGPRRDFWLYTLTGTREHDSTTSVRLILYTTACTLQHDARQSSWPAAGPAWEAATMGRNTISYVSCSQAFATHGLRSVGSLGRLGFSNILDVHILQLHV